MQINSRQDKTQIGRHENGKIQSNFVAILLVDNIKEDDVHNQFIEPSHQHSGRLRRKQLDGELRIDGERRQLDGVTNNTAEGVDENFQSAQPQKKTFIISN